MYVKTVKYVDACDLNNFVQEKYGRDPEIPYMSEGRSMHLTVRNEYTEEELAVVKKWAETGEIENPYGFRDVISIIMSEACSLGELESGDYIAEFDD